MKTLKFARTAAAALALCAGFAQASPIVTDWTVTDFATFVPTSVTPGGNTYPLPVLSDSDTQLHWGDTLLTVPPTPQSGLIIGNSGIAVNVPTGVLTSTVSVTHDNFVIPEGSSLQSADILASLTLQSAIPSVGSPVTDSITFGIHFIETLNSGIGGICADGGAVGAGINSAGCADIFVISANSLNFPFFYDSDGAVNGVDPEPYFVSFFAAGYDTLSNAACQAAGAAIGCRGFETAENLSTTADFKILITSTPFETPEPGSMALVGGALAALGWVGRRRKSVSKP